MPERIPDVLVKWRSDSDKLQPMKHHLVGSMVYKPVVKLRTILLSLILELLEFSHAEIYRVVAE